MVKDSKKKAAKSDDGDETRSERIAMRMHPDLVRILDKRADEKNLSRSAYIESILIGWVRADPRNPRVDPRGKLVEGVPSPKEYLVQNALGYANRWQSFNQAYRVLFGTAAPDDWEKNPTDYWMGDGN
ncbi:hypothetical protein [Bradyrhizobium sp.]|uniref:hypothetical protein n=1 Tax=Bradyrhizobium sp. TaxID=376 RepID=UPI0007C8A913|nr:hypothetical protein [Bradyrhizobium sp.]